MQPTAVHYLPIATTVISFVFAVVVYRRYLYRGGGNHLLWWSAGILVYGLGTFAESWFTLFGWSPVMFKFWYVVGALLGGAPLAQGTVWLLLRPRVARRLTIALVSVVTVAAACVIASPINMAVVDPHLPSGRAFAWQWVRAFSPFINTYAVIFLIGGAIYSAWRFYRASRGDGSGAVVARDRFVGNVFIASGAILPGIGGAASRMGRTEVLYVMEIIGILLIWTGYWLNVRRRSPSPARPAVRTAATVVGAVMLVASVAPVAQAQQSAIVEVTVYSPNGRLAPSIPVSLRLGDEVISRTTNQEGLARFEQVGPGTYLVVVDVDSFRRWAQAVEISSGSSLNLDVELQLAPYSKRITVAATHTERDTLGVPGEVTVIDRDDLDRTQARGLDDVLRYEPGVEMSESPRRLGQTPNIRGFDDQRILTLRDGARVAQFNSGHRGTYFFDTDDIEKVEIVKGPASALYGSGAIGGVISITTRAPDDLLDPRQTLGAQVRSTYSSAYGEWTVAPRLYGRSDSGLSWMASYTGRRNDGSIQIAGVQSNLEQAEEDINDFNARLHTPLGSSGLLRLSGNYFRQKGRSSTNLALMDVGAAELIDRATRSAGVNARYTRTGENWWDNSLNATVYVNETKIDESRIADGRVDDIGYRTWGIDARNTALVGGSHAVTYGFELVQERQDAVRNGDAHAFFPSGSRTQLGTFVQDELSLFDGRLSVVPGLRYDRWNSKPDLVELSSQKVDRLSPKLGASYQLSEGLFASASYGGGFRAPFFQELFLTGTHFAFPLTQDVFFLAVFLPNEDLVAETSRNFDGGLRFRRGRVSARASLWRADVENFIELLPVFTSEFPVTGGTQIQLWQATNRLDAQMTGFEASVDLSPQRDIVLRGSFSRTRGEDNATGEPLLQIPNDKLVLGAEWRRPELGLRANWFTRIYGDRDRVPTGVEATAGYVLHDFQATWATGVAGQPLELHLAISNLADRSYENARFGTPGIGRDIRLGTTVRF